MEPLYEKKNKRTLDSRGVFLMQTKTFMYIWIGKDCVGNLRDQYLELAINYAEILKKYEKGPQNLTIVED